ncbi:MAG: hypothetical protein ACRDIX_09415 [Actinomycetota bacterium]
MRDLDDRLRDLDRLPAPDLWMNITSREPERIQEARLSRRIGVAALAFAIAAAGIALAWWALPLNSRTPGAVRSEGFVIILPEESSGVDDRGLAILDAETNLPDGTIVALYYFSADVESPSRATVTDGRIESRVANNLCHDTEVGLIGTAVRVTVTVRPEYRNLGFGRRPGASPPVPITQPPNVQKVLGAHFERLVGEQVQEVDGQRYLEASRTYELPSATCASKLKYTGDGSFLQVPVGEQVPVDTGPFPRAPFAWCPDARDALPVEAGEWSKAGRVAHDFDLALQAGDAATLSELADPSVRSLDQGWRPTGSPDPQVATNVPSGFYLPEVTNGCGSLVALRTWGVVLSYSGQEGAGGTTYLLVLRPEGWKVWGSLPGRR